MLTNKPTTRRPLWLGSLFVVGILMGSACGGDTEAQTAASPSSSAAVTTTTASPDPTTITATPVATTSEEAPTAAVEVLLDEYYASYNGGDAATVIGMLSELMRETPAPNLEFWIGTLHEQVSAECVPSPMNPEGVRCVETYTDALHGPVGATGRAVYQYFERNGKLMQVADESFWSLPGCRAGRCPGEILEVAGADPTWTYDQIEADLVAWLNLTYPDVASTIDDPRRLQYLAGNSADVAAVLPYVDEFASQSTHQLAAAAAGADIAGMATLEAVEGMYAAMNSHDPAVYEEFFGEPPNDVMEWFWAQGRHYERVCAPTANPDEVRCEGENTDEFYTKAGAVFEIHELWTKAGDELLWSVEWANSSGTWAYHEFEQDLGIWMREAYPADAEIAFPTADLVHNGEAAAIAVSHLDEFLEVSDKDPREPGAVNDWLG